MVDGIKNCEPLPARLTIRPDPWWPRQCIQCGMPGRAKRFVYIIRSDAEPMRHYIGITGDVRNRLEWHNHGPSGHTVRHWPWSLLVSVELPNERAAMRFERYLKSGSGRAFTKRHFAAEAAGAIGCQAF